MLLVRMPSLLLLLLLLCFFDEPNDIIDTVGRLLVAEREPEPGMPKSPPPLRGGGIGTDKPLLLSVGA
jgi:hypothetical protein